MTTQTLLVLIINWNTRDLLHDCLSALRPDEHPEWDVLVVDNASTDGSVEMLRSSFPAVRVIESATNVGYARANNVGLRTSIAPYALLLNSDTRANPETISLLVAFMEGHPEAGVVSPRLLCADGTPQAFAFGGDPTLMYLVRRAAWRLLCKRPLHDWATPHTRSVDWVSGACLLARRTAFTTAGLLDENFFMYFEDIDWCKRMRKAGWRIYYHPDGEIVHLGGQSLALNPQAQKAHDASLHYYYRKHHAQLASLVLRVLLAGFARLRL